MMPLLLITTAYLIGAIPFGLLLGFAKGVDIRKQGSGNIGATNAGRVLGRPVGLFCLALDIAKGLLPTLLAKSYLVQEPADSTMMLQWVFVGGATVIGHTFPIYLGFRGGKGVATTIGACLGLFPVLTIPMIAALLAYGIGRYATGIVSVGSLALAAALPVAFFVYAFIEPKIQLEVDWPIGAIAVILSLLIIVRHRSNIGRLVRGEERAIRPPESNSPA